MPQGLAAIFNDGLLTLAFILVCLIALTAVLAVVLPMIPISGWKQVGHLFLGVEVPPALVAWMRLLVTGAISTVVIRVGDWAGIETPDLLVGTIVGSLWGILDQWKKSRQNAINPPPTAGGPNLNL